MDIATLAEKARHHWTTWLPAKTAQLQAQGTLTEATQAAAKAAQQQISELMNLHGHREHEAMESALKEHILLPPEPPSADDWEARELDEKEAQYQKVMRAAQPQPDPEDEHVV